jgi:Leishmanolysin/Bacterial Ig-like domain (group 2)
MRLSRALAGLSLVAAGILACGEEPPTNPVPVPTSLLLSANNVSFNALGATQQISATVRDQNDAPIAGLTATFTSGNPAVATVSAGGLITAVANGSTTVTVSHASLSLPVAVGVSQVVSELAKIAGDQQTGLVGDQLTTAVEVELRDGRGNVVPGGAVPNTTVQFVAANGGSVSDNPVLAGADGRASTMWTLGPGAGAQQLTATVLGGAASAQFVATAALLVPPSLVKVDGDGQTGLVGAPVNIVPRVKVQDQSGAGVPGVSVTFTVTGGGGSVAGGSAVTDGNGVARPTSWTLGGAAGANTLGATSATLAPVSFSATGATAQFNLELRYFGPNMPTAGQQAAFAAAEAVWESAIFGELTNVPVNQAQGQACFQGPNDLPAINETIDDLVIFAKVDSIDGPGNILGQARPCLIRASNALPVVGLMFFDKDDLATLESNGTLSRVVLHEMGHVLGFGTLWNQAPLSLMASPCPSPTSCTTDPHFVGPRAIAAFDEIGGTAYTASQKVPLEDCVSAPGPCGDGTVNAHWRESVFGTELMTGFISLAAPLSAMTIASLFDLAYQVNYSADNPYTWPAPAPGAALQGSAGVIEMKDDVLRGPIQVVDATGRVVRVVQP